MNTSAAAARAVSLAVVALAAIGSAAWLWFGRPAGVEPGWFVGVHVGLFALVMAITDVVAEQVAVHAPGGRRAARALTAIAALVVAPLLAERAMTAMERSTNRIWSVEMWERDEALGEGQMRLKPNVRDAVAVVPDRPVMPEEMVGVDLDERVRRRRIFEVNTNAAGLRGVAEVDAPKTRFRMLCLGSSVTFGHGVADDESWCSRVGEALDIEALNGGMPGRTLTAVANWAALYGTDLDPDLVVLSEQPFRKGDDDGIQEYVDAARSLLATFPEARLAIALAPMSPFVVRAHVPGVEQDSNPRLASLLPGVPVMDTTAPLVRAAAARGGLDIERVGDRQRLVDRATDAVLVETDLNVPSAAICAAFEADPSLRIPFFIDTAHLDAEGHAVLAETIITFLRTNRLVPEAAASAG